MITKGSIKITSDTVQYSKYSPINFITSRIPRTLFSYYLSYAHFIDTSQVYNFTLLHQENMQGRITTHFIDYFFTPQPNKENFI